MSKVLELYLNGTCFDIPDKLNPEFCVHTETYDVIDGLAPLRPVADVAIGQSQYTLAIYYPPVMTLPLTIEALLENSRRQRAWVKSEVISIGLIEFVRVEAIKVPSITLALGEPFYSGTRMKKQDDALDGTVKKRKVGDGKTKQGMDRATDPTV